MDDTLYCIESLPSISVAQSVTTAVGFPFIAGVAAGIAAVVAAGGSVAAGAGVSTCAGAVAGGATSPGAGDDLSLQAVRVSAQATASTVSLIFIVKSPWFGKLIIEQRWSASCEGFAVTVDRCPAPRASHPDSVAAGA
jgi:hypothetical protein